MSDFLWLEDLRRFYPGLSPGQCTWAKCRALMHHISWANGAGGTSGDHWPSGAGRCGDPGRHESWMQQKVHELEVQLGTYNPRD